MIKGIYCDYRLIFENNMFMVELLNERKKVVCIHPLDVIIGEWVEDENERKNNESS